MREEILKEATRLMAAQGASGTTIQAIADAVGIRKPSVLYHFASKEALRKAVLDQLLYRWNEVLPSLLLAPHTSGQDRFQAIIGELMSFFADEPDRARLLVRELLDRPDAMERYLENYIRPWLHVVEKALEEGKRAGVVQADLDPTAYTLQLTVLSLGSIATADSWSVLLGPDRAQAKQRHLDELTRIAKTSLFTHRADQSLRGIAPHTPEPTAPFLSAATAEEA